MASQIFKVNCLFILTLLKITSILKVFQNTASRVTIHLNPFTIHNTFINCFKIMHHLTFNSTTCNFSLQEASLRF